VRARETAEIIAAAIGAEVVVDARLRERNFGKTEGAIIDETSKQFPSFMNYHSSDAESESYAEVEQRVWECIEERAAKHPHKKLLFVGHGGTTRVFLRRIKNLAKENFLGETGKPGMIPHAQAIGADMAESCSNCGHHFYEQDPDVFDTWFSSGQWPFVTLMTNKKGDFEKFYPTDVMATASDILFFWVARMTMFGLYRTGKAPFKTVYLHGVVRDKDRQKMSKSKGNVIDPLGVAEQYGMDAMRMALISGNAADTDPVISEDKIKGYRNFTTKIWNMAKFMLEFAAKDAGGEMDAEVLKELEAVKKEVTSYLDEYKLHLAAESIYHYVWHAVADKIIEANKAKKVSYATLQKVFSESLKMLHPFMPFVTEEVWSKLGNKNLLMIEPWSR
jgi:valyl-tRNA synthetase